MEEFIALLTEQWPEILKFCLYVVLYFLVILYRVRVKKSAKNMKVLVKEHTEYVSGTDKALREDVKENTNQARSYYNEAAAKYNIVVGRIENLECAIRAILGETEVIDNGTELCEDGDDRSCVTED